MVEHLILNLNILVQVGPEQSEKNSADMQEIAYLCCFFVIQDSKLISLFCIYIYIARRNTLFYQSEVFCQHFHANLIAVNGRK